MLTEVEKWAGLGQQSFPGKAKFTQTLGWTLARCRGGGAAGEREFASAFEVADSAAANFQGGWPECKGRVSMGGWKAKQVVASILISNVSALPPSAKILG